MSELAFVALICTAFLIAVIAIYNNVIIVKKYTLKNTSIKSRLNIVLLADVFTDNNSVRIKRIIDKTEKLHPDLVIITGRSTAENGALENKLVSALTSFSEVCCVDTQQIAGRLGCTCISRGECRILDDYSLLSLDEQNADDGLSSFSKLDNFKIAVASKPSFFGEPVNISAYDIDLALSWHGGGMVLKIPVFGALYTKEDGFFPRYSRGIYRENNSTLIVSGSVGKSSVPFRINNFREIVNIIAEN